MNKDDFSAMRRELFYQEFMLHYLQDEQKKRWEELDEIKRNLAKLKEEFPNLEQNLSKLKEDYAKWQNNPKFKELMELAAKRSNK
jgi:hypothetical protein